MMGCCYLGMESLCDMEIEIVTLVEKGSAKLIVPTDWEEQIQVARWIVALHCVFQLMFRGYIWPR